MFPAFISLIGYNFFTENGVLVTQKVLDIDIDKNMLAYILIELLLESEYRLHYIENMCIFLKGFFK